MTNMPFAPTDSTVGDADDPDLFVGKRMMTMPDATKIFRDLVKSRQFASLSRWDIVQSVISEASFGSDIPDSLAGVIVGAKLSDFRKNSTHTASRLFFCKVCGGLRAHSEINSRLHEMKVGARITTCAGGKYCRATYGLERHIFIEPQDVMPAREIEEDLN